LIWWFQLKQKQSTLPHLFRWFHHGFWEMNRWKLRKCCSTKCKGIGFTTFIPIGC
jgi:hypothetical protein